MDVFILLRFLLIVYIVVHVASEDVRVTSGNSGEYHTPYYSYDVYKDGLASDLWENLSGDPSSESLEQRHKIARTVSLPFDFPFYGHTVSNVTIISGGFLYLGTVLHEYLTATQYVAPLMADFNSEVSVDSATLYKGSVSKFVVQWKDVYLDNQQDAGPFSFQATLHHNGTIVFTYLQVPVPVENISESSHPVKVGLSNGFYTFNDDNRMRINEYNRVALNETFIQTGNVILFQPKPTCTMSSNCTACLSTYTNFTCKWCEEIGRCSDGIDWYRQQWDDAGCTINAIDVCITTSTSPSTTESNTTTAQPSTTDVPEVNIQEPVNVTAPNNVYIATGDQLDIQIEEIGSQSVSVSWLYPLDTVIPMQFVVQLRTNVTSWYNHTYEDLRFINDRYMATVQPLLHSSWYYLRMFAYTDFGRSNYTAVIPFKTEALDTDPSGTVTTTSALFTVILPMLFGRLISIICT